MTGLFSFLDDADHEDFDEFAYVFELIEFRKRLAAGREAGTTQPLESSRSSPLPSSSKPPW